MEAIVAMLRFRGFSVWCVGFRVRGWGFRV